MKSCLCKYASMNVNLQILLEDAGIHLIYGFFSNFQIWSLHFRKTVEHSGIVLMQDARFNLTHSP